MPLHSAHLHSCRAICWFMRIIKIPESSPVLFQMFSPATPPPRPLPLGLSNTCPLFVGNWNSPCLLHHCVGLSKTRHFTRGLIRSNMYLFSVYYVWVCSRGMFPSRQNTDLAAIICLPCFSNSKSALLSYCRVSYYTFQDRPFLSNSSTPWSCSVCSVYKPMWQICFPKSCCFSGSFHLPSCELRVDFSFIFSLCLLV